MSGFILKAYDVRVQGFPNFVIHAASRGKAFARAFDLYCAYNDCATFKMFLKLARVTRHTGPAGRFGEPITVGGKPAFYVSHNPQYIEFVRPDSDVIMSSHPYDVEPPEARRGTPYYQPECVP